MENITPPAGMPADAEVAQITPVKQSSRKVLATDVQEPAVIPAGPAQITLKEYCVGKPVTVLYGMAALHGDPRYATNTRSGWAAAEQEFWKHKV